jgi:hypothetical protein
LKRTFQDSSSAAFAATASGADMLEFEEFLTTAELAECRQWRTRTRGCGQGNEVRNNRDKTPAEALATEIAVRDNIGHLIIFGAFNFRFVKGRNSTPLGAKVNHRRLWVSEIEP